MSTVATLEPNLAPNLESTLDLSSGTTTTAPGISRIAPSYSIPSEFVEVAGDRFTVVGKFIQLLDRDVDDVRDAPSKLVGGKLLDPYPELQKSAGLLFKAIACKGYPEQWFKHKDWGYTNKEDLWCPSTPIYLVTDGGRCYPQRIDLKGRERSKKNKSINPAAIVNINIKRDWQCDYLKPLAKEEVQSPSPNLEALVKTNQRGWGIYAHVHGIGINKCVTWEGTKHTPSVLMFEFDNLGMDDQVAFIDGLDLKPNWLVVTRKSIHAYYLVDGMDWSIRENLQRRLVAFMEGSDSSICDAARLMRVPGFDHVAFNSAENTFEMTPVRLFVRDETPWDLAAIEDWLPPLPDRSSHSHKIAPKGLTPANSSFQTKKSQIRGTKQKEPINLDDLSDNVQVAMRTTSYHLRDKVLSAIPYIKERVAGENTYQQFTESYWAVKNTYGVETADELFAVKRGDLSDAEWERIRDGNYNFTIGTLFYHARANGWSGGDKIELGKPDALSMDSTIREIFQLLNEGGEDVERLYLQGNRQYGYTPVRLKQQESHNDSGDRSYTISQLLSQKDWAGAVNEHFVFYIVTGGSKNSAPTVHYYTCPTELAERLRTFNNLSMLCELRGISHIPAIRSDGTLCNTPGYDRDSKLLLLFDPADYADIPKSPTQADAVNAIACIKELLAEFPFVSDLDGSCALSLLLTAVTRKCYALAPMHVINAASPGTGKSTLAAIASKLLLGDRACPSTIAWDAKEEEMAKKLLAVLGSGAQVVNLDNCNNVSLRGAALESILTSEFYSGRILGSTAMLTVPNSALGIANGNHVGVVSDAIRRTIGINLESPFENPSDRSFRREILPYVTKERVRLVSALLTVTMACLQSSPNQQRPLPSYEQWDRYVRQPLVWLGEADPVDSQKLLREEDPNLNRLGDFLSLVHSVLGDREWTATDLAKVVTDQSGGINRPLAD
ncbi:hypothetical protein [Pseudanabaena sp. PCC 6802]|uniref:hypothetical protein n=1 Tax=Pseudanabaena sp. PCC 6802 TaxID=118173 RepID=UPI0012EAB165|nr:hypothetical protein [Pseudanabaena sp. PCC 6802]